MTTLNKKYGLFQTPPCIHLTLLSAKLFIQKATESV